MEIIIAGKRCRAKRDETIKKLEDYLKINPISDDTREVDVRKALLPFVEQKLGPAEWLLYDGNTVWDVKRLIKQFKTFVKYYDVKYLTEYLYEFFHLQCGSIAHYNKFGWFETYPTLDALKEFFKENEYGSSVMNYPPDWHYDARLATEQMHTVLFGVGGKARYPKY